MKKLSEVTYFIYNPTIQFLSNTNTNWLVLLQNRAAAHSENYTKQRNKIQNAKFVYVTAIGTHTVEGPLLISFRSR